MKKTPFPPTVAPMRFPAPEQAVMMRLGYSRWRTQLSEAEKRRYAAKIAEYARLCAPRGCWTALPVEEHTGSGFRLAGGYEIASAKVAERYPDAAWMWLGAATIGPVLPEASAAAVRDGRTTDALIADAVGSECADAAMDFLQKQAAAALARNGMRLAEFRFSPGYGDWDLAGQRLFFDVLDMAGLGIRISDTFVMLPEKSVTAVAGVVCG